LPWWVGDLTFIGVGIADVLGTWVLVIAVQVGEPQGARRAAIGKYGIWPEAAYSLDTSINIAGNVVVTVNIYVATVVIRVSIEARHEGGVTRVACTRVLIITVLVVLAAIRNFLNEALLGGKVTGSDSARVAVIAEGVVLL